jgi:hypothetical protein
MTKVTDVTVRDVDIECSLSRTIFDYYYYYYKYYKNNWSLIQHVSVSVGYLQFLLQHNYVVVLVQVFTL